MQKKAKKCNFHLFSLETNDQHPLFLFLIVGHFCANKMWWSRLSHPVTNMLMVHVPKQSPKRCMRLMLGESDYFYNPRSKSGDMLFSHDFCVFFHAFPMGLPMIFQTFATPWGSKPRFVELVGLQWLSRRPVVPGEAAFFKHQFYPETISFLCVFDPWNMQRFWVYQVYHVYHIYQVYQVPATRRTQMLRPRWNMWAAASRGSHDQSPLKLRRVCT